MKKIFVRRDESVAELVDKIINVEEDEVVLVVPKASGVAEAVSNFDLIKQEARAAGKKLYVESVDEKVLALAKSMQIEALHPFFEGTRRSVLSDIVPATGGAGAAEAETEAGVQVPIKSRKSKKKTAKEKAEEVPIEEALPRVSVVREEPRMELAEIEEAEVEKEEVQPRGSARRKLAIFGIVVGIVALIGGVVWVVNTFFSTAQITINFKKTPWAYANSFLADSSVSRSDKSTRVLPGQVFTAEKNFTQLFKASGMRNVSTKATGVLTISNAYSSEPQSLVASTRFETPDGKIFRLTRQTVVPGAQIKDGKIIPSQIQTTVTADVAGAEYNLGPVARLTIPGFKGTPKFAGFYGELAQGTKGGFVGQKPVPTPEDIKAAQDKTVEILRTVLESNLVAGYPVDFKYFDSGRDFKVTKLSVNENTDDSGNFSVFGEAKLSTVGFREADLVALLTTISIGGNETLTLKEPKVEYKNIKADVAGGKISFSVAASGTLTTNFAPDDFQVKIRDQKVDNVRFLASQLPGLTEAKISVWPIWLQKVPSSIKRINIVVQ